MTFEEKEYEIRVLYNDVTINVVAFLNNHPVNGFRHQVTIPKGFDVKGILKMSAVKELVEMSENDILEKRWEKLLKIMRESKQ
ncbi:hypothetical protein ACFL4V_02045 [Candidatus Latescibacterota bacterium]